MLPSWAIDFLLSLFLPNLFWWELFLVQSFFKRGFPTTICCNALRLHLTTSVVKTFAADGPTHAAVRVSAFISAWDTSIITLGRSRSGAEKGHQEHGHKESETFHFFFGFGARFKPRRFTNESYKIEARLRILFG